MRLISKIIVLSFIYYTNAFTYSNFYYNKNKLINNNNKFKNYRYKVKNIFCRFQNNISRRNILYLSPIILNPKPVMSKILEKNNNIKNVLVFGAGGYTGGDTIRNLIEKNINVIAVTRRPVKIVNRINANKDTLVIDDINKINKINSVIADVLKPETLKNIMKNVDAVIFCAASRPKVTVKGIPGVDLNKRNNVDYKDSELYAQESNNVEDIGLVNVAKEAIKNNVKKLIIVSSICAKCQKKDKDNEIYGGGEVTDKGETTCKVCYDKQEGEERVRILYENLPLSYTIIRPGMLSPGEKRGVEEVEFNQGVSKSGIISRMDLADILVESTLTDNSDKKTFEVYYKDTAQPVDMFKSLKTCKEMGKSVKECFFGEDYKDDKKPIEIDKLLKNKIKGSIFLSGREIIGNNYEEMFKKLKKDEKELYDINILKSNDII
jgi:nucleoside-diphosphate-sugar epimerase